MEVSRRFRWPKDGRFGGCGLNGKAHSAFSAGQAATLGQEITPFRQKYPQLLLQDMPVNGSRLPYLVQSQARSLARSNTILPYRCLVHRTICHHAQPRRVAAPQPTTVFHNQRRSAKTKSTVKLKDLPQGAVKLEPYQDVVEDTPRYPTVVQGHRNNMQKFKNCVVLTRVGGFYEVFTYRLWSETY